MDPTNDRETLILIMAVQTGLVQLPMVVQEASESRSALTSQLEHATAEELIALNQLVERFLQKEEAERARWFRLVADSVKQAVGISAGPNAPSEREPSDSRESNAAESVADPAFDPLATMHEWDGSDDLWIDDQQVASSHESGPIIVEERYELLKLHAHGGSGTVWRVFDKSLHREVALKRLRGEHSDNDVATQRFFREARLTGQLDHPGVIPVFDILETRAGEPCYTMRWVEGRTLAEAIREYHRDPQERESESRFQLTLRTLLNAFLSVCHTVAFAHSRGVIHRDIKGTNVLLGEFGEVLLLDWGIAESIQDASMPNVFGTIALEHEVELHGEHDANGMAIGTPAYMSPEQARGSVSEIDERTDVYGLGALLYEILTGKPPFAAETAEELLRMVCEEEPLRPCLVIDDIPAALDAICMQALSRDPQHRFQSAREFANEIDNWQERSRSQAEAERKETQSLYASLLENLPVCVWRKDQDGKYVFANDRMLNELGVVLEELRGRRDEELSPVTPQLKRAQQDENWVLATGQTLQTRERRELPDGSSHYVQHVRSPIKDADGQVRGTQGVYWDITERHRLQEELDRLRAKTEGAD